MSAFDEGRQSGAMFGSGFFTVVCLLALIELWRIPGPQFASLGCVCFLLYLSVRTMIRGGRRR